MCGISSSIINLSNNFNQKLNTNEIEKFVKNSKYIEALKKSKDLRRNNTFVKLVTEKNNAHRSKINKIIKKCKDIKNDSNFEIIDDLIWTLEYELLRKADDLKKIINKSKLFICPNAVVFIYHLLSEFENINYLESRGRDSASLSVSFVLKKKTKLKNSNNSNKLNLSINKISNNKEILNITLKTANRIGYSGENVENLKHILLSSNILPKIDFNFVEFFSILTHTRWATVGNVNLHNCHPLIVREKDNCNFYSMNGDITNYKKIYNELKIKNKINVDKKCTNDLVVLNEIFKKNLLSKLKGSFVITKFDFKNPKKIFIYKKGEQGLYYSKDIDNNTIIASDVYGIVNRSYKYNVIKNNIKVFINNNKNLKKFSIYKNLKQLNISSKDFNKINHETYFQKEISDTELFIKRTVQNYVNLKKNELFNLKLFDSKTKKKIKNRKINNIIFTGMGSCYTAAVGISKYLLNSLRKNNIFDIKVESTIASEGSGFYLNKKMDDTIIIVLAQSGTTIDTNVYAKMARKRGAYTLSIVNKKFGDVTYIVQKNLYLGNGRDVELAVPSTKTYSCHLILGYILCENILNIFKFKNKYFVKDLLNIIKPDHITKRISKIEKDISVSKVQPVNYNDWYVVYDKSLNASNALELRIKLSECCYKSIPYLTINQFNELMPKKSLVFYMGNKIPKIKLDKTNYYIFISGQNNKNKKNNLNIKISNKNIIENSLESALSLQLISYSLAKKINFFSKNKRLLNSKSINFIYDKFDLEKIKNKKDKHFLLQTLEKFKRPIDTIKHQAKTITVGAIRSKSKEKFNPKLFNVNIKKNSPINKKKFENIFKTLHDKIYISSNERYEIYKYYICNIIDKCNFLYNHNKKYFFVDKLKKIPKNVSYIEINHSIYINNIKKIYNLSFHNILIKFLKYNNFSNKNELSFSNCKNYLAKSLPKVNLEKYFYSFNNVKLLGSGINYLIAKKYALKFSKKFKKAIAFDVIENHKHIDISSEPLLIIFAANIFRRGFQTDVVSEIEKFLSHNNKVIIFTNIGNGLFDQLSRDINNNVSLKIIKLPVIDEIYSAAQFDYYFNDLIK